jgi:Carboxypeptidase regulatory-like domain
MQKKTILLVLCLTAVLWTLSGYAQTPTGTIEGTVLDSSGAAIPNVTVTITNAETNNSKVLKTDNEGRFQQPLLTPGNYSVQADAAGFRQSRQDNVTIEVSEVHPVNFSLVVGSESQSVEVTATTANLETSSSTTGQVITARRIVDLPLNGRNPFDLATLVPGVSNIGGASTPHIAGSRNANNEQQLDGVTNILPENNVGNNSSAYQPIVDSVQEFNVQTSVLPAEYGRFSGGVINLATRTGTNGLHGTVFEFARNAVLDAKDFYSTGPKPDLKRNQWGGTAGGPILIPHVYDGRNRSFFFFAYENSHETDGNTETDSVPTAAERLGDFSALGVPIYDPLNPTPVVQPDGSTVYNRTPFPGNIIPANRLNQVGVNVINYYPLPNTASSNGFNNYVVTGPSTNDYYHFDIRLDHDWTKSWHTFVRFSHSKNPNVPFSDYNGPQSTGYNGPATSTAYSMSYDNTFVFKPTLLGEVRYGFSRSAVNRTPFGGVFDTDTLGLPPSIQQVSNYSVFPNFSIGNGYSSIGSSGYVPLLENPLVHDATASLIKISGAHTVKVGGEFRKLFLNFHQFGDPSGQFNVDQSWTQSIVNNYDGKSGNPFASLLLGLPASGDISHDTTLATASGYVALYAQDDWRVTPTLTINAGLRWDVELPRTERHNQLSYWNENTVSPIQGAIASSADCPNCGSLRGAMSFVGQPGASFGRRQAPTQWKDFAPRIGFSFSANKDTVIRGGFGLVYAASTLQAAGTSGGAGVEGFGSQTSFPFTFDSERTINTTLSNPAPSGFNLPKGVSGGASTDIGSNISDSFFSSARNPYSEQANFNVQRSLPGQTVLEVGYLYNKGLFLVDGDPGEPYNQLTTNNLALGNHLYDQVPNPFYGVITTPGSTLSQPTVQRNQLLRPFPQYTGVMSFRKATADSNYNAVTVRLDKRFSQGLTLLLSFTGAKLFDTSAAAVTYLGPTSGTRANQYNKNAEYAVSPQDVSRQLVISFTDQLPFGRNQRFLNSANGVANSFISGWQVGGIITDDTGTPVVLGSVNDETGLFPLGQRPTATSSNAKLAHPTRAEWFNTAVFSQPVPFTIGNAPRTLANVRTPGPVNADLSAFKNNYFGAEQRYNVQFRVEAFNSLNHPVFGAPDAGVNDGNYGKITSQANSSRQVQLAVKFYY